MTDKQYLKKLQVIIDDADSTNLKKWVAQGIKDEVEGGTTFEGYISDLLSHGCVSGMVGELVYYADTHKFFDEHYEDIMDLVKELNDQGLEVDLIKDGDLKNTGAWLAYEETARQIANEIGFDY